MSKKLVAVAMSGGIDSSVTAVRLKLEGHDVIGLTMKLWDFDDVGGEDKRRSRRCCSLEMFDDARSVCHKYGIPHYVLNMHSEFNATVVADFVSEYVNGRTPNPCVVCNQKVKWELLETKVRQLGCDYLATGHYARIRRDEASGRYQLLKGVDTTRDQSYFLWGLKQESLAMTLFPLGEMRKSEVRQLARQYGLANAEREESREICFVPDNDYARLVKLRHPELAAEGIVRDSEGNVVGKHEGYFHYTLGQRKKIQIATTKKYYVTRIIPEKNEIVIGSDDDLFTDSFAVTGVNWVSVDPPFPPDRTPSPGVAGRPRCETRLSAAIKIRYLHKPVAGEIRVLTDGDLTVTLSEKQRAVTPGQSCVFYDGELLLGGSRIV